MRRDPLWIRRELQGIALLRTEDGAEGMNVGGEQSGHIEAIGFELYTTMLEEAVRKMKGEEEQPAHAGDSK